MQQANADAIKCSELIHEPIKSHYEIPQDLLDKKIKQTHDLVVITYFGNISPSSLLRMIDEIQIDKFHPSQQFLILVRPEVFEKFPDFNLHIHNHLTVSSYLAPNEPEEIMEILSALSPQIIHDTSDLNIQSKKTKNLETQKYLNLLSTYMNQFSIVAHHSQGDFLFQPQINSKADLKNNRRNEQLIAEIDSLENQIFTQFGNQFPLFGNNDYVLAQKYIEDFRLFDIAFKAVLVYPEVHSEMEHELDSINGVSQHTHIVCHNMNEVFRAMHKLLGSKDLFKEEVQHVQIRPFYGLEYSKYEMIPLGPTH